MVMVIESFRYRPSPQDWSNLFFKKSKYKKNMVCQIVTLYMVMVTESFGYRPSPRDWSNLFSKKYIKKRKFSNRGPLHGNGHRIFWINPLNRISLIWFFQKVKKTKQKELVCQTETLYLVWSNLSSNLSSFETRRKLVFLSLLIFY